ncbi:putative chromatin remodeling complex subunit (Chd3) [Aspergillus melleus]|uniref:putative chromatin remodeling complex subunit (Chd3) n=1 Tax=Aspergillus melleus TaxID=138277 RepID=UPI001E8D9206|nr:uncharacterized protein LDX57_012585 [Aspergillus melleus]KAH8434953.1 hypothetical protein LDX57_012585 [Aspergillus melleus]
MDYESAAQLNDDAVAQLLAQFNNAAPTTEPQAPPQEEDSLSEYALAQQALASHALVGSASAENSRVEDPVENDLPQDVTESASVMEITETDDTVRPTTGRAATAETIDHVPRTSQLPQIEVPALSDSNEYEFLPGHFEVRCVISETDSVNEIYKVKLRSREVETVSSTQLESLSNGQEALIHFQLGGPRSLTPSTEDDSSSDLQPRRRVRRLTRPKYTEFLSTEDDSSSDAKPRGRGRRSTRLKQTTFTGYFEDGSDRMSRSRDSSDDIIASSRRTGKQRRLGRGRRAIDLEGSDVDSDFVSAKGTRFSTRSRKSARANLRDRFEDDISEHEGSSRKQKFFGAREAFYAIPSDDPFRLKHRDSCDACRETEDDQAKGPLVFCQGCTSAYHQSCLGPRATREHLVTKVSETLFLLQCRRCLGVARSKDSINPHLGCCTSCDGKGKMAEPLRERLSPKQEQQLRQQNDGTDPVTPVDEARVNNVDNVLFRCISCQRAFHFEHLLSSSDEMCQDCVSVPGEIGAMVAWRPKDPKSLLPGYTASVLEESDKDYLIKWKSQPYSQSTWMDGTWVWGVASHTMRRAFLKSDKNLTPHMTVEEAIPEDYMRIDIVFEVQFSTNSPRDRTEDADMARVDQVSKVYVKYKGLPYEETVWDSPPDRSQTERWNDFTAAYNDWVRRDYIHTPDMQSLKKHLVHVRKQDFKTSVVRETQPEIMTGGEIMDYQKDGMNWLYYMWFKQQNAILADEMGLGKTIQVIALFATLIQDHKCWPFLVVVPNSTCPNWRKELKQWVPSIGAVTYYGSAYSRQLAQTHEMFGSTGKRDLRCHVVITSYETMTDDASRRILSRIPWGGLIVDEGQRLKNDKSQLYDALSRISFPFKILLTGTPLQNNIRELFNLLQFLDPTQNAEKLEEEFGVLSKENIPQLHDMIRPFFLRRTKAQVLTFLPPVAQIIVPVSMTVVQKKLYKSILAKDPKLIKTIFQREDAGDQSLKQTERHNLNNILMQLRKCLCHPFIYSKAIEERSANAQAAHRHLVDAAGKLQLLELMLPKLQKRGHRVLIFSQFLDNLDLVEDFLDGLGLLHRRLDGRMSSLEKQKVIDEYNAEGSPYFAFLLSTRSGGVGINLATADTVIIMDPDFNPHQDMQALSRAHRIGQKNKVLVFQLMTRGSAEEKIMQIGKSKMVLDHVLIDRMDAENDDGRDLESILRHGAQALFEDDNSRDIHYDSDSVDKLLDRSQAEQERPRSPNEEGKAAESHFSFARVWANESNELSDQLQNIDEPLPNATIWEKILQEREQAAAEEARRKTETLGRGKRKRTTVDYGNEVNEPTEPSPVKVRRVRDADSDKEFVAGDDAVESEPDSAPEVDSDSLDRKVKVSTVKPFKRVSPTAVAPPAVLPALDGHMDNRLLCLACNQIHPVGHCRLKLAGVEHCGLCGLAHFGYARTCPHIRSEIQVGRMLKALKQSTEDPELVRMAKKYLTGVRGNLVHEQKKKLAALHGLSHPGTPRTPGTPNTSGTTTASPGPDPRVMAAQGLQPMGQPQQPPLGGNQGNRQF